MQSKSKTISHSMCYADLSFMREDNYFRHNLDDDFAIFALWKSARPYLDEIRGVLASEFEVLLETEIVWSEEHFHNNASRLYEVPISDLAPKEDWQSGHAEKIGQLNFILFVVKDKSPKYSYDMSVSKKIELANLNVVKVKYQIRDLIYKDLKVKYSVHSTNNIYEFFFQTPLLLGLDNFEKLLNGERLEIDRHAEDLQGANGWKSYQEVFSILNITNNYLVLRGFETLPSENEEQDLDVLTDNYQRFASALGAKQDAKRPYKAKVLIAGESISLDMRFVGDKYYDVAWSQEMLRTKVNRNGVFVPREDHYFFSLLFHAKVQKPEVKLKYIEILQNLAEKMNFAWYDTNQLENDPVIGQMLNGYFRTHGYFYEDPIDTGVYKNAFVIKHLQAQGKPVRKSNKRRVKGMIKNMLPDKVAQYLSKLKNK